MKHSLNFYWIVSLSKLLKCAVGFPQNQQYIDAILFDFQKMHFCCFLLQFRFTHFLRKLLIQKISICRNCGTFCMSAWAQARLSSMVKKNKLGVTYLSYQDCKKVLQEQFIFIHNKIIRAAWRNMWFVKIFCLNLCTEW